MGERQIEAIQDAISTLYWLEQMSRDDAPLVDAIRKVSDALEYWEELLEGVR